MKAAGSPSARTAAVSSPAATRWNAWKTKSPQRDKIRSSWCSNGSPAQRRMVCSAVESCCNVAFPIPGRAAAGTDSGHRVRWRGQLYPLRFGDVELLLSDNAFAWRWPAVVAFSPAPIRYPILGQGGCLQFMDAYFLGADLVVELETNPSYPGTTT